MKYQPGMFHINETVRRLQELHAIVSYDGKFVNIKEFVKFAEEIPLLLEHAMEAQAYMKELIDPEYPDQQRKLNVEHEREIEGVAS